MRYKLLQVRCFSLGQFAICPQWTGLKSCALGAAPSCMRKNTNRLSQSPSPLIRHYLYEWIFESNDNARRSGSGATTTWPIYSVDQITSNLCVSSDCVSSALYHMICSVVEALEYSQLLCYKACIIFRHEVVRWIHWSLWQCDSFRDFVSISKFSSWKILTEMF